MKYEIIISNTTDLMRVSALDIMGIKADGNYSSIVLNDGESRIVLFQLGQLEDMINRQLGSDATMFIRIGRGLIINREYLHTINLARQSISLRSANGYKSTFNASKESLKQLKTYIETTIKKGTGNE